MDKSIVSPFLTHGVCDARSAEPMNLLDALVRAFQRCII